MCAHDTFQGDAYPPFPALRSGIRQSNRSGSKQHLHACACGTVMPLWCRASYPPGMIMSRCTARSCLLCTHLVLVPVIKTSQCMRLKPLLKDKICSLHKPNPIALKALSVCACVFVHGIEMEVKGLGCASPTNPTCFAFDVRIGV